MVINISHLLAIVVGLIHVIQPLVLVQSKSIQETFKSFQNVEEFKKGQIVKGLNEIKSYLNRFGYLNYNQTADVMKTEDEEESDQKLEDAVKTYQKNFHLNVTGKLDTNTVNQMMKPRCGSLDNNMGLQYAFFDGSPKWPDDMTELSYRFDSSLDNSMSTILKPACRQAFDAWENITQFTFTEVPKDSQSDIVIGYYRGDHGDGYPFDGPGRTAAHAFAPTHGVLHFDADESWSLTPNRDQTDAISIAVHETGHLLGLAHTSLKNSIMNPSIYTGETDKRLPRSDDVEGIKALYNTFFFFPPGAT